MGWKTPYFQGCTLRNSLFNIVKYGFVLVYSFRSNLHLSIFGTTTKLFNIKNIINVFKSFWKNKKRIFLLQSHARSKSTMSSLLIAINFNGLSAYFDNKSFKVVFCLFHSILFIYRQIFFFVVVLEYQPEKILNNSLCFNCKRVNSL